MVNQWIFKNVCQEIYCQAEKFPKNPDYIGIQRPAGTEGDFKILMSGPTLQEHANAGDADCYKL